METIKEKIGSENLAANLGLLPEEFAKIKVLLGREPNETEVYLFSAMWSEHCSYKNSLHWLRTLPKEGTQILKGSENENAGCVSIGDGLVAVFKIESHNHPSAIEPFQGAATGVGGINRDIFTLGARPIAQMNSLRFGNPESDKTKHLIKEIVKGISSYGNAFGVPTVGGEVYFDECYNNNPLVNVLSLGIVNEKEIIPAIAKTAGNTVYVVGSATGRDGINGASFASGNLSETSASQIPSIQIGDPFTGKKLLEAILELVPTGAIEAMQDLGAAGIICATSELSGRGGLGMKIDLEKIPLRQNDMKPAEILISESQERMILIAKKGRENEIETAFEKWDLVCAAIGVVTDEERLQFSFQNEILVDIPPKSLLAGEGAPVYERKYAEPASFKKNQEFNIASISIPSDLKKVADFLTSHPDIASRRWVYEQYDSMVGGLNLSANEPSDASIIDLQGTSKALALTVDGNARYVNANPETGAAIAVAEAARNIICSGGEPLAITNCLNFGNPYDQSTYWQFVQSIKGISTACRKFNTPVSGGNVSFYNQFDEKSGIFPTPVIGMLGILPDKEKKTGIAFRNEGDLIFLIGESFEDIGSSIYLNSFHGIKNSPAPYFDITEEYDVQNAVKELIKDGHIHSAHDVSDGGLYITLLESGMPNNLGFSIYSNFEVRIDAFLFGETQSRIIVSVSPDDEEAVMEKLLDMDIAAACIGVVTSGDIIIDENILGKIEDSKVLYDNALEKQLFGNLS